MKQYYNPVRIVLDTRVEDSLGEIIYKLRHKPNILLLTGKSSLKNSGRDIDIKNSLPSYTLYDEIPSNPEIKDLYKMVKKLSNDNFNIIISIGGGSVLDMAKSYKAISGIDINSLDELETIIAERGYTNLEADIDIISVPTTSGTGSEVTSWATIWDKEKNKKYSIESLNLYSEFTIVDSSLTKTLSKKLTAITALDAISHALEAYWSKKSNPIVRTYAKEAIGIIIDNIFKLLGDLENEMYRRNISLGSLYAGMAFSNTKTTVCHSLSYPLTLRYGIPHGIAVSMTLYQFLIINENKLYDKNELLKAFRVNKLDDIDKIIKDIYDYGELDYGLEQYGVLKEELFDITKEAFTPDRIGNNPVKISENDMINVLNKIY